MDTDKWNEVLDEILLYLHRRNYEDKDKEMIKTKIMYFIFKGCSDEENYNRITLLLDKIDEQEKERKLKL